MVAPRPVALVALGGNALVREGERGEIGEQRQHVGEAVAHLPRLIEAGYDLVVTHGNGPVVGHLLLQNEASRRRVPAMPLDVCDADSEGSVGYLLQQALGNELRRRGDDRPVASLVTQVVVDPGDPAFAAPSKPVGPFYHSDEAVELARSKRWTLVEDAGRGHRRVVPSPLPLEIVEIAAIRILLAGGAVVIAAGGGGIPVVRDADGTLRGIEAVVDKDHASALLGLALEAHLLVILTSEECVYRRYASPEREPVSILDAADARDLLRAGEFPPGSMGPKIEAALKFLDGGGREVLITLPERLAAALDGGCGTRLRPSA